MQSCSAQCDIMGPYQHTDGFRFEIDLYRKLKQLSENLGADLTSEVTLGPCDSCKLEVIVE